MRALAAFLLTSALVIPAFAQPPGGGRGFGGFGGMGAMAGGLNLLRSEDVQKEIKLTDEQKTKLRDFQSKMQETMRSMRPEPGQQPDFERLREIGQKMAQDTEKFMKEFLTESQNKRLKQIQLQQTLKNSPTMAFFTMSFGPDGPSIGDLTETGKALKITDDQKERIQSIGRQLQEDLRELRPQRGQRPTAEQNQKIEALRKEATEKIMEVLTEEQRKILKELQGEEFKGRIDAGFGPGQGGRRGPGGPGGQGGQGGPGSQGGRGGQGGRRGGGGGGL